MSTGILIGLLLALSAVGALLGRRRAYAIAAGRPRQLHSRPTYHAIYTALMMLLASLALVVAVTLVTPGVLHRVALRHLPANEQPQDPIARHTLFSEIDALLDGSAQAPSSEAVKAALEPVRAEKQRIAYATMTLALILCAIGFTISQRQISLTFRARTRVEAIAMSGLQVSSVLAILVTVGIVLSLLFESGRFFAKVPLSNFFGAHWSPQTAMRADQVGSSGDFGSLPLFFGTGVISALAMFVAVPIGLMAAIYLTQYASSGMRKILKPVLEILAGVPTVVYGFFAAITVAPQVRRLGEALGLPASSESALAAGLVMGVMIIPFMSSLSDDAITAVPASMRDGSLALGATPSETIRKVLVPAALPGIVGGFLLAVSRAIGETMIVVMAAGLAANITFNPFASVTTVTTQIVAVLTGDQEFDSPKTLSAFALGLVLFLMTLVLNVVALRVVKKYREAYD